MKAILIVAMMSWAATVFGAERSYISYDDFIRQAEAGKIASITLDQFSSISGTMIDEGVTNAFQSFADTGSANDPLLIQFLKENDIEISIRDQAKQKHSMPMMTGFMFLFSPLVFLILLVTIVKKLNRILENQKKANQQTGPAQDD